MAKPPRFGATEPLQIYQDDFFDQQAPVISHAPMPLAAKPPRRPLQPSNRNVVLNPPNAASVQKSPFKANNQRIPETQLTSLNPAPGNSLNMVPMMPPNSLQQATDCLEKKQPLMARFKTVAQKPPQHQQQPQQPQPQQNHQQQIQPHPDLGLQFNMGKENSHLPIFPAGPQFNLPLENYYPKPPGKRALLEAAPIKELRPGKKPKPEEPLPTPDSFPPIFDDGTKPNHSYATLIGMAILRSPERRLTLAQIYKWISDTFSFYNPNDAGWQNSIRHNLSLNKNFIKKERPKDDPGKGNYWAIEPGTEHLFMKEKPSRKVVPTLENIPVMSTRLEPSQPHMYESMLPPQPPMNQASLPVLPQSMPPAPSTLPDISSDATIPMSELGTLDDMTERVPETEAHNEADLYSPLPAAMHSSPPIPKHIEARHSGTPPQLRLQQPLGSSASKSRSRKRRFTSMDDSGYISSLESSAMRPNQHAKLLTSEADRPRLKRGRAEEEIARLRASSYDSPSKGRSFGYPPVSSSPLRHTSNNGVGQMLPPLTPAMKLKAPPKPPPSVSPSTNLRLHRETVQSMVDSPYRRVGTLLTDQDPALQLTPGAFNVEEFMYGFDTKVEDDPLGFDIFQDTQFGGLGGPCFSFSPAVGLNGSPTKRSAKRQRIDRSLSTSALNDTPKSVSNNGINNASFLKVPGQSANNFMLDTPSKVFDGLPSSPSKAFLQSPSKVTLGNEENMAPWLNVEGFDTPDFFEDNESAFDILAGFEKIGSSNPQSSRPPTKGTQKPSFGRCYSTGAF
ncbi:forkhead protein sep1 [Naviculisporaceae sp. PSN 640]